MRLWWRRVGLEGGAAGRGGAEGAAVEALQVKFYTQAVDAPGANSDKFQQPEGRVEVPPTQFILGVADVPVVQSIPQVQSWPRCSFLTVVDVLVVLVIDTVVHSLEARRSGGLAGQEAVCSFLQAGCRSSSHR